MIELKKRPGAAYPESEHSIECQVSRENYPDYLKTIMSHCEKITPSRIVTKFEAGKKFLNIFAGLGVLTEKYLNSCYVFR